MPLNQTLAISFMLGFSMIGTFASPANAATQEGIVYNSTTGDYSVTYKSGYSGQLEVVTFIPSTKIDPSVKSVVEFDKERNIFSYKFKVKNGTKSQQSIDQIIVLVRSFVQGSLASPGGWPGSAVLALGEKGGVRLSWSANERGELRGLAPGTVLKDIALESLDLPGMAHMEIRGNRPITKWMSHYPAGEVGDQMDILLKNDFVPHTVAVPRIPVPAPFNAAVVLGSVQQHVKTDMVSMQLVDPALFVLIDRSLTQAIAAAQVGNTSSLLHEIKNLRKLLKQEHADVDKDDEQDRDDDDKKRKIKSPIDRLAARVLDFDLKYVEKLVKEAKD